MAKPTRRILSIVADSSELPALLARSTDEQLRRAGSYRALVLRAIARRYDPIAADVAKALREAPPDPAVLAGVPLTPDEQGEILALGTAAEIKEWTKAHISDARRHAAVERTRLRIAADTARLMAYVARTYVERSQKRRRGPKPARTLQQDTTIVAAYFRALDAASSGRPRRADLIATRTQETVASEHNVSVSLLQKLIKNRRARFSNK